MTKGQCVCGCVKFKTQNTLTDLYACHCSICRKSTGTFGVVVAIVANTDFEWTEGQNNIAQWKKSHGDWQKSFCKICGSPLPDKNDENHMYIPAGLLTEGTENLKVRHHMWVDSKAVWHAIGDSGKQHAENFGS